MLTPENNDLQLLKSDSVTKSKIFQLQEKYSTRTSTCQDDNWEKLIDKIRNSKKREFKR